MSVLFNKTSIKMKGIRLIIIGDPGVGKTTFINSLIGYPFHENYIHTVTTDKYVIQNGMFLYTIFDNFHLSNVHEGIEGIIIMGSVTVPGSVEYWRYKTNKFGLPVVTVLNKSDLVPFHPLDLRYNYTTSCKNRTGIFNVLENFKPVKYDYSMYDKY